MEDYPKLNLKKVDAKHIVLPTTKIPVTRITNSYRKLFKTLGLLAFSDKMAFPKKRNIILDTTIFASAVDKIYKPASYRQRAGILLKSILHNSFASFTTNYKKVLVYSIDTTKPINGFFNRKIFPVIQQLKSGEVYFDHLLLVLVDESGARYRLLVKDGEYKIPRLIQYLKNIKLVSSEEEKEEELKDATGKVVNRVKKQIEKPEKVKAAVSSFLQKQPVMLNKISSDEASDAEMKRTAVASILHSTSGDVSQSNRLAKTIPDKELSIAVKSVSKRFKDDMLEPQKSINSSEEILSQQSNIESRVENKTPEPIFDKRRIDFETNLKKDMVNAFKVLENRDIPLKFVSIKVKDKPQKAGEIEKSDKSLVVMILKDKHNKTQEVSIEIPKIDPKTGTFRINGQRKCLINQIVLTPISFPKEFDSKFESSYSRFHIYSKRTKRLKYLEVYMGAFRLPLSILLSYAFGFEQTLKDYGISYKITKEKPEKDKVFAEVPSSYIVFEKLDTELKEEIAKSFVQAKVIKYEIDKKFLSKDYFNELIIKITGRIDATHNINNNILNVVDPISAQVLANQHLPHDLKTIIKYMATKVVTGFVQDRNDITNQRIRNSEVLVMLAQKELLKAYTTYRMQYLAGNKDAKIFIPESKIMSQFNTLEIAMNMEYANPAEEMATMTKVSPVGKSVGGIPDKRAVNLDGRNVHPTYYGNIDPLDTAEGGNVGITQQLTVNAYITSARGLFGQKPISDKEKSGLLSTTVSMIPFIENNEGARVIMAANQAKQMLPLRDPEPPMVQSGYESLLTNVLSDNFVKRSPCAGKISRVTSDYIEVVCNKGPKKRVDITPVHLKSGSGKDTLSTFRPIVKVGQSVKNEAVIAEGSSIANGTISMGRTLSACYMPYKGYNFEDGIVINEKLVANNKLTSLHGVEIEANVERNDRVLEMVSIGERTEKGQALLRKSAGDIDELLGYSEEEDDTIDTHDGQVVVKSPGGVVVDIQVFSNIKLDKFPKLKELVDRTDKLSKKPSKEKYSRRDITIKGILVVFKVEQELVIGLGDKLCNRYGNKGIISLIEKDELMPRTPWGETVDIIHNPLGVLGRMNMGQMYELYCGLISKGLANRIIKSKSKAEVLKLLKSVLSFLDTSSNKKYTSQLVNSVSKFSTQQFNKMVQQIKNTNSVPIIIPPFQAPKHTEIKNALKFLGLQSGYNMKLPEFNTKTKNKVPFGYQYMAKLEHLGAEKIHSRSTGPSTGKTKQPTSGKRREGGQRMGEGDTWALTSYNCTTLLSEFFGPLSDDTVTKNEIITEIIQTGDADFKPTKTSPTKDLLNAYFVSLMLGE